MDFKKLAAQYKNELLNNVVPFWLTKSQDLENGGYFTCLDRKGDIYDTDKFVWLQARQVWLFSMLYNRVEEKTEWLECAKQGGEFLKKYGHDGNGNWYFCLTREGKPLVRPYNIFSYTFAAMAFAQLGLATGNEEYTALAMKTYERILERQENPKGKYNKAVVETRKLRSFALPMIMCNLNMEMEFLLGKDFVDESAEKLIEEVMNVFYRPEFGLIVENVNYDGSFSDTFDGRLLNPGHAIEAMWFVMDLAERLDRKDIVQKAQTITLQTLKHGWDNEFAGIFYFMDAKNHPPQQLEWDMKLWWVHLETLVSLLKGYYHTGENENLEWFKIVHDYTWKHFKDNEYPEWFGYLNRRGEVTHNLKGGKWKGCFHVPRGLFQCWQLLEKLA